MDLANLHDVPIAPGTWEAVRREAAAAARRGAPRGLPPFPVAVGRIRPGWAPLLHDLHDAGLLERFIPEFARARGLLQFNQYHKYTVDEHCLRAVEFATRAAGRPGAAGPRLPRHRRQAPAAPGAVDPRPGQGLPGRPSRGRADGLPSETAQRLGLRPHEAEALKFLVHKHLRMNHLAFRRDTSDEQLVVRFAVQVGSPELLQMLVRAHGRRPGGRGARACGTAGRPRS